MRKNGAIFVDDLLTAEDRREMAAWSLVFTDVLGVLEQNLLARSSYFHGSSGSWPSLVIALMTISAP
jgi:hypothetical protein